MNRPERENLNSQRRGPHAAIFLGAALGILALVAAGQVWAHGVRGTTVPEQTACLQAEYDDGEPMSYARVEIQAPGSELPFQSGRTDRNGRFCFLPDIPGAWGLEASDAMGHKLRLLSRIDENMVPSTDTGNMKGMYRDGPWARSMKIVDGLAVIFGSAGLIAWWRSRKRC